MYQVCVNGSLYECSQDKTLTKTAHELGIPPWEIRYRNAIRPILIEKPGQDMACGAIGIGEVTTIPTAPAVAGAYFALDGEMRTSLPLMKTPYERAKIPRYWW